MKLIEFRFRDAIFDSILRLTLEIIDYHFILLVKYLHYKVLC